VVTADPGTVAARLADCLARGSPVRTDRSWRERWARDNRTAWRLVDDVLADRARGESTLSEGAAVRAVADGTPDGAILAAANGLPVRSLDWYLPAGRTGWSVWSQRGANGIDGLIAGATGACLAAGRPTVALLGDVAFAHDVGSLAVARDAEHPLVLVVVDNRGGRIFELLPEASALPDGEFERLWLTPPTADPVELARAFGVRDRSASSRAETTAAVAEAAARPGPTVVRIAVDPSSHASCLARIRSELAERWSREA
jgi:2-succinyl-5-enolpyruvyl-6-hydroxy-3-cyclohexene-1-carboxylate synthase